MLKFFYNAAPNPMKVALLLEELGLPYEAVPVDTRKGEQFSAALLAVNPNAKVPAVKDGDVILLTATPSCCSWPSAPSALSAPTCTVHSGPKPCLG